MPAHEDGEARRGWRIAFVLGLCLTTLMMALCGCAPMRVSLLQPQALGGEIRNSFCPPQPDVLLFERDGVVAAVHTRDAGAGRRVIHVSFEIPAHQTVRLLGSSLEVARPRGPRVSSPMIGTWYGSGNRSAAVHADSLMRGRTQRLRYGTNTGYRITHHDFFLFSAEYATALGDTFTVTLPKIMVNGFSWDLPDVRFVRVNRWVIMPFNC